MTAPDVRPEPSRADVERYAEALGIRSYHAAHPNAREDVDRVLALVAQDRAVDAATIEGLRAEVERLRSDAGVDARGTSRAERLWGLVKTYRADLEASEDRAEAAESALTEAREQSSRLRALADLWAEAEREARRLATVADADALRHCHEDVAENYAYFEGRLRAVLAGVAEQEAGEAVDGFCTCDGPERDFMLALSCGRSAHRADAARLRAEFEAQRRALFGPAPSGSDDTKGGE
jgi:hypothetical protein